MTIKQQGGIFGRNPTFNNVEADGTLTVSGQTTFNSDITIQNNTAPKISILDSNGGFAAATITSENGGRDLAIFAPQDIIFDQNGLETARFLLGGGLTFNGDTAAANALDDYEEGTWTPTQGGTATLTSSLGLYTKIGRMVQLQFYLTYSSTGTPDIGGLPFTANSSAAQAVATIRENNTQGTMWQGRVDNSATTMVIRRYDNASLAVTNGILIGSCTYTV